MANSLNSSSTLCQSISWFGPSKKPSSVTIMNKKTFLITSPFLFFTSRQRGGSGHSDLGRKRCQTPKGVPIAIATMQWGAIAGMDALHHPGPGGDFEVAIGLDGRPSHVGAHVYTFRDHGSHHIPGPKAM